MDATAATTPTETPTETPTRLDPRTAAAAGEGGARHARPQASWRLPAVIGALAGGALLVVAVPQFVAAVWSLEAEAVLWDVRAGSPADAAELRRAVASLDAANRWFFTGEAETERGYLLLKQAEQRPAGPQREALLRQAATATAAGLAAAPAQPSAWARLAYLRALLGEPRAAGEALRLSLLSGPVPPGLLASRLAFGLTLLPHLDEETTALLRRQVRYAWLADPEAVVRLAKAPATGPFVTAALGELSDEEMAVYVNRYSPP